jgi:hypothetical protein
MNLKFFVCNFSFGGFGACAGSTWPRKFFGLPRAGNLHFTSKFSPNVILLIFLRSLYHFNRSSRCRFRFFLARSCFGAHFCSEIDTNLIIRMIQYGLELPLTDFLFLPVLLLSAACFLQSVSGQAMNNFQTDFPNISIPLTRYAFSVECDGTASVANFRFAATATCASLSPACTLQQIMTAGGKSSWGCVASGATLPSVSTFVPSAVSDVCDSFVDITCTKSGFGTSSNTYQVSQVIGGVPSIANATTSPNTPAILVGSEALDVPLKVSLRGSAIPGNQDEVSGHMEFRWAWYRSLTAKCGGSNITTVTSLSSTEGVGLNVTLLTDARADSIDGCTLELAGVSRRGVEGNFTAATTRRIAAFVLTRTPETLLCRPLCRGSYLSRRLAPRFTPVQPTRGYYIPTAPAIVGA